MPLFRRRSVPDAVRAVALEPGERRLGWGLTTAGEAVLATSAGLRLPGRPPLPWADVEKATWRRPTLTVTRVSRVEGEGQRWQLELADEDELPDVVRTQVTGSVAWSNHVRLTPSGGVRLVGRRRPGQELLDWQLVHDVGTDPDDPQVQAQGKALVEDARRTIG
ncbi:MAG: hypothetical protein JWM62_1636 [Frankiales bacterium]|nr:hypothetical protein [Frankiales bacterium]